LPRRTGNFASPSGAQFWYEWRRAGFLLPVCVAFALVVVVAPLTWKFRTEPKFTVQTLIWIVALPIILGFIIGKGFIKADAVSASLSIPPFLAVRPMSAAELVSAKLRVAAVSVVIAWATVILFVALWLPLWADNSLLLNRVLFELQQFYPHSWRAIIVFYFLGLVVLTWRCMVNGLWLGLSGKPRFYFGSMALQVIVPTLLLLACAIWSKDIDRLLQRNPALAKSILLEVIGWTLALLVIGKMWLAVFSWSTLDPRRTRRYVILWTCATAVFVGVALLWPPPFDTYREEHLRVLIALLFFPFARLGAAPRFFEMNRAR
jgi:MFS family permease